MINPYPCTLGRYDESLEVDVPVGDGDVARTIAALISPDPGATRPVDVTEGIWEVWLPAAICELAAEGLDIDLRVGAYRLICQMDPL